MDLPIESTSKGKVKDVNLDVIENDLLNQLILVRDLKNQKKELDDDVINSDEEYVDPREDPNFGQTRYFTKPTANEIKQADNIKRAMHNQQHLKRQKISESKPNGGIASKNFAEQLMTHKKSLRLVKAEMDMEASKFEKDYKPCFEIPNDFKLVDIPPKTPDEREKYTGMFISKRYIPEDEVEKMFENMKVLRLRQLFSRVAPPEYQRPAVANFVVIGCICHKSEPLLTSNGRSKYIVLKLSNFRELQVNLTLFGGAFIKYWKVKIGDIIAVLNPDITVLAQGKGFSLKIGKDSPCILEIAHFRNMGHCKHVKNGKPCKVLIDMGRKQQNYYCEYHTEARLNRDASQRPEMGSNVRLLKPKDEFGNEQALFEANGKGKLVTNYSSPDVILNVLSKEEKSRTKFSNKEASKAFFNDRYINKEGILKMEKDRKRDKKLREEKEKHDEKTKQKAEKEKRNQEYFKARKKKIEDMNQFLKETAKVHKVLKMTRKEKLQKKKDWDENTNRLNILKQRRIIQKDGKLHMKLPDDSILVENMKPSEIELSDVDDDSDTDEDLEQKLQNLETSKRH